MKLEGGERLVLKNLLDLQGDSGENVEDVRLAAATKMAVQDVRDWLETLEGKGFVERTRLTDGLSAYVTAKGKQALRLSEPIANSESGPTVSGASNVSASSVPGTSSQPNPAEVASKSSGPIRLFYSYSHKDEKLREKLDEHLSVLKRQGFITGWHDRKIGAGEEWKGTIDKNLEDAQVILLLVSASFLASDYCYDVEMKRAVEQHDQGGARVIPIILRPCDWHRAPFGKLQALPRNGKPVVEWRPTDSGFKNVAEGVTEAIKGMTVA